MIMAAGLIFAACGSDDDATGDDATTEEAAEPEAEADAEAEPDAEAEAPAGEGLATEGSVEIAAGTTLNLDECPDDWDATRGITDDEIILGMSLPQSGPLAAFGDIGAGMEAYFAYLNDTDPIDGKQIELILADDAYEAGRTSANVQEMIDSDEVFALTHIIGTGNNLAARPITDDACVPQLFNSTGFPLWGDPANFPWTIGNILNYETETAIWCADMNERFPDGATVAALINNNDFGKTYQNALQNCDGIEVIAEQLHAQDAPDIANEMTTLIASGADVLIGGTTGAYCPQAAAALAGSDWRPVFYNSYTCNNLSSFYAPVEEAIGVLGESAPILANSNKICGDPTFDGDPAVEEIKTILADYGDTTCEAGSFSTGVLYGQIVEDVLRPAAAMPGGLNRVNLMSAVWNMDATNDTLLGGSFKADGVNDAFITESAQLQRVVVGENGLTFEAVGDAIDVEGQGGSYVAP
jgi:ABC-type branched-subunit amino acid transport system substrate-binding protein